jgi:glucose dehydrogenase
VGVSFGAASWRVRLRNVAQRFLENWNELTVDEKRGIAYIPFGTGRYDFYGANRHGQNLFGNSVVALDARTGKRLWHFQTVHHDLWDYDLPMVMSSGLTSISPSWSQITAYDLNTGTIKWQVPDGGVSALPEPRPSGRGFGAVQGYRDTGALAPRGGIVATAGGLLFVATASDRKFRAYDHDSGQILWEKDLPAGVEGVPAVYEIGGREYIALCAAVGDGNIRIDSGKPIAPRGPGSYIVLALPQKSADH